MIAAFVRPRSHVGDVAADRQHLASLAQPDHRRTDAAVGVAGEQRQVELGEHASLVVGLMGDPAHPDLASLQGTDTGNQRVDVFLGDHAEADRDQPGVGHRLAFAGPFGGIGTPVRQLAPLEILSPTEVVPHHRADVLDDRRHDHFAFVVAVLVQELVAQQAGTSWRHTKSAAQSPSTWPIASRCRAQSPKRHHTFHVAPRMPAPSRARSSSERRRDLVVRRARVDELHDVLAVHADGGHGPPRVRSPERDAQTWDRMMRTSDLHVYLAFRGLRAVGTASLTILPNITCHSAPSALIEAVVVVPDERRRGWPRTCSRRLRGVTDSHDDAAVTPMRPVVLHRAMR